MADIEDKGTQDAYRPVFPPAVRTAVYVVCLLAGVAAVVFDSTGHADVGGVVATAASLLAGGFGVAYNPLRM